jgi:hypothetical protein
MSRVLDTRHQLLAAALRYEQKTAAIQQSMLFLSVAEFGSRDPHIRETLDRFSKYLQPHGLDIEHHFAALFLISVVSRVEYFFVDTITVLVRQYPKKVGSVTFKLSEIITSSREELILAAIEAHLTRVTYKRPAEYLEELVQLWSIDSAPLSVWWPEFVENKARRDLGIHNDWIVNRVYKRKIGEVG